MLNVIQMLNENTYPLLHKTCRLKMSPDRLSPAFTALCVCVRAGGRARMRGCFCTCVHGCFHAFAIIICQLSSSLRLSRIDQVLAPPGYGQDVRTFQDVRPLPSRPKPEETMSSPLIHLPGSPLESRHSSAHTSPKKTSYDVSKLSQPPRITRIRDDSLGGQITIKTVL